MNKETRRTVFEKMSVCPHCNGEMNDWFRGNYRGVYFYKKSGVLKTRHFCTKECYEDYKQNFVNETYNDEPIYCIEVNEEKRYMPYFEAYYYFTDINDCKKRMDMKNVAIGF